MKEKENREQGAEGAERIAALLRWAMPPVEDHADETHDLWPAMLRRLRVGSAVEPVRVRVPWFDWALAAGLVVLLVLFPAWIPVLLYYL